MTRIDIAISNLFYDPLHQVFPLEHVRLFEQIRTGPARRPLSGRCCRFSGRSSNRKNALDCFACWIKPD
jgi:hypothetical protein